jgi:hypothetical protein
MGEQERIDVRYVGGPTALIEFCSVGSCVVRDWAWGRHSLAAVDFNVDDFPSHVG